MAANYDTPGAPGVTPVERTPVGDGCSSAFGLCRRGIRSVSGCASITSAPTTRPPLRVPLTISQAAAEPGGADQPTCHAQIGGYFISALGGNEADGSMIVGLRVRSRYDAAPDSAPGRVEPVKPRFGSLDGGHQSPVRHHHFRTAAGRSGNELGAPNATFGVARASNSMSAILIAQGCPARRVPSARPHLPPEVPSAYDTPRPPGHILTSPIFCHLRCSWQRAATESRRPVV